MARKFKKYRRWYLIFAIGVIVLLISSILLFVPVNSSFNIDARVENIEFSTVDDNMGRFVFYDVDISNYDRTIEDNFFGSLKLNGGVKVTIERVLYNNLFIVLESNSNEPVGILYDDNNNKAVKNLGTYVEIVVPVAKLDPNGLRDSIPCFLTIDGDAIIGKNIDRLNYGAVPTMLKSGTVSVISRSILGNFFFESENWKLYPGDEISFNPAMDNSKIDSIRLKGQGFVLVDENPGLLLNYRRFANGVVIRKAGPKTNESSYVVSVTAIDLLIMDKVFKGISLFFGFVFVLITITTFFIDYSALQIARKNDN